jgi:deoxycytidine triphosphate deaminase
MRIAQVVFHTLQSKCKNPYSSEDNKYQGQEGAQPSKIKEDFE